jgi:hypothetical protein
MDENSANRVTLIAGIKFVSGKPCPFFCLRGGINMSCWQQKQQTARRTQRVQ